ncbi:hypothetical protein ACN4EG_20540 [Alkalinema pantanalense CENA528]
MQPLPQDYRVDLQSRFTESIGLMEQPFQILSIVRPIGQQS